MRFIHIDKSSVFLFIILLVVAVVLAAGLLFMRTDAAGEALKSDRIVKALFVIEDGGKPILTEALLFYPASKRAAVFDIPEDTGQLIKPLGRVDRLDAVFKAKDARAYRSEIEKLLGTDVSMSLTFSLEQFGRIVDLLDGLELFIPNSVELRDADAVALFPQGTAFFDGDKVKSYLTYQDPGESETDLVSRKQKCFLSLLKRMSERSEYLRNEKVLAAFESNATTNLDRASLKGLLTLMGKVDAELIVPTRVQGRRKEVEGGVLLFPAENGDLLKEIVKQNLNALVAAAESSEGDRVFTLEILNGTTEKGLAKKAGDLYESFGYDVLRIENADTETNEKTVVYDRVRNERAATNIAAVIHATKKEIVEDDPGQDESVDFTIILGKDFNGRYCIP